MTNNVNLLSEVLRPQHLGDLTLSRNDIRRLEQMVQSGNVMNMIFHGKPGLGKTSAARTLIAALDAHAYEVNGSSGNGSADVRAIEQYATTVSIYNKPKLCLIDEADYLSHNAQASLRYIIERTSRNCRFLFTVNNLGKISDALRSRMRTLCFDIAPSDRGEVIKSLIGRYQRVLPRLGIRYDEQRLQEIVGIHFPDLRAIANEFEYEFVTGEEPIAA